MNLTSYVQDRQLTIALRGEIDHHAAREIMQALSAKIDLYLPLHCRSSQRSYYALCCLRGHGYHNLTNISGSFLGISLYEYFHDKSEGRKPIVTAYNFD